MDRKCADGASLVAVDQLDNQTEPSNVGVVLGPRYRTELEVYLSQSTRSPFIATSRLTNTLSCYYLPNNLLPSYAWSNKPTRRSYVQTSPPPGIHSSWERAPTFNLLPLGNQGPHAQMPYLYVPPAG
jgi:hypothetical protein